MKVANLHGDGCEVDQVAKRSNPDKICSLIAENRKPSNINGKSLEGHSGYEYSSEEWQEKVGRDGAGYWLFPWPQVAASFCRDNDGIPNRVDRIKGLGNSIVPQVAYEIFKAIETMENK